MKASAAAINGALAVAGLLAAWATWQRPKETLNNEHVTVLEASKSSLGKVRFEDGTRILEVFKPEGQSEVWLRQEVIPTPLTRLPTPLTAEGDGGVDAGWHSGADGGLVSAVDAGFVAQLKAEPPPPPQPPRELKGNERAQSLLERFTPFEALRALGKLSPQKQQELGLEGSTRKLTVTVSGQPHLFVISTPQQGVIGSYLRDERDGTVYLLTGSLLTELEPSSQALVERRLHSFRGPDFDEFVIGYDGAKYPFVQRDAEIPQTMKVAPKDTPDKPDELVRNWHDKVWSRLLVTDVLGKGEAPRGGEPKVELRIDYLARGTSKGFLELGKSGAGLWARSENTAGWVGLHTGTDDVIAEAKKFTATPRP